MRFREYLSEQKRGMTFEEVCKEIAEKCKPFLESDLQLPIFRGVHSRYLVAGFNQHPESRPPRDSGPRFNFMFNAGFQAAFKVPSIRTRTIFASGSSQVTSEYGAPAFFFPAGHFQYAWSKEYVDSFTNENAMMRDLAQTFRKICSERELAGVNDTHLVSYLTKILGNIGNEMKAHEFIKNDDRGEAVTERIVDLCWKSCKVNRFYDTLVEALRTFFEEKYLVNEKLSDAVASDSELFFYETDGYYLVPCTDVISAMNGAGLQGTYLNEIDVYEFLMKAINSGHR